MTAGADLDPGSSGRRSRTSSGNGDASWCSKMVDPGQRAPSRAEVLGRLGQLLWFWSRASAAFRVCDPEPGLPVPERQEPDPLHLQLSAPPAAAGIPGPPARAGGQLAARPPLCARQRSGSAPRAVFAPAMSRSWPAQTIKRRPVEVAPRPPRCRASRRRCGSGRRWRTSAKSRRIARLSPWPAGNQPARDVVRDAAHCSCRRRRLRLSRIRAGPGAAAGAARWPAGHRRDGR